ncbi:MAG: glycogen debranching protein [Clostridiales bacterium]|nr:glycogen debranching protein [Clostridiales bacterium]
MNVDNRYAATAGQTSIPFGSSQAYWSKWERLPMAEGLPEIDLNPEYQKKGWYFLFQAQHFIPNITARMLDWFWCNQEKCYYLWAPGSHKSFQWVREPWRYGFTNSGHISTETMLSGQELNPNVLCGSWYGMLAYDRFDMDAYPFDTCLDHCILEGSREEDGTVWLLTSHSWEDTEGGVLHRMAGCVDRYEKGIRVLSPHEFPIPGRVKNVISHMEYETSMWPKFLPKLYDVWKDHPDPAQNVFFDLRVRQTGPYRWEYLEDNTKPVV